MSKHSTLLIRVQSAEGTKRVDVDASDTTCHLFEKIHDTFDLSSFNFALYKEKNNKNEISSSKTNTVKSVGLRHGDMIYLTPINGAALFPEVNSNNKPYGEPVSDPGPSTSGTLTNVGANSRPSGSFSSSFNRFTRSSVSIKEDEVDLLLYKLDGKVERKRDDKLCRHNANSRCVHCSSIEPFDEAYLHEHNIKHMSFHTYLRKMTSGVDQGKFLALEDISCHIKNGCKDHPPWPKGICSKCQPSAITLNAQTYRHVDNVAFENTSVVEKFLDYWRITGHQRIGFLYGYYGIHSDVPLGIRANVVAIYEPPQESTRDSVRLLPDEREELVEHISKLLGLRRVGWIFTDLIPEDVQKGTVKHTRNIQSHFVSAQECIMAGHFQNQHPNPCRFASTGVFGSKFVTICVTGDSSNQVHMEGYQVSNQCMALVRDNCLVPTKDAPELGYVRESSDKQYVPDVYYKEKDSYGNDVTRPARPLPVEYLLLDIPTSTPLTPHYTFNPDTTRRPFPVEHRQLEGHVQDFHALAAYLSQFGPEEFPTAIRDYHLLLYIAGMETLPMLEHMTGLLEAVKREDEEAIREWRGGEQWATVEQLVAASSPPQSRPTSSAGGGLSMPGLSSASSEWTCKYCTYVNNSEVSNCEMCSLPRSRL